MEFKTHQLLPPPEKAQQAAAPMPEEKFIPVQNTDEFSGISFSPAGGSNDHSGEVSEVAEDSVFSMLESAIDERIQAAPITQQSKPASAPGSSTPIKEMMPPEFVEISAEIFVEMYEGIVNGVCQMWGDPNGNYLFNRAMKTSFMKVTTKVMQYKNVNITPEQLFGLMALFLMFSSGMKAYKDKNAKKAIANAKTKKDRQENGMKATGGNYVRKNYEVDEQGRYVKGTDNAYVKQSEREYAPSTLLPFITRFKNTNGKWPGLQDIQDFEKAPQYGT